MRFWYIFTDFLSSFSLIINANRLFIFRSGFKPSPILLNCTYYQDMIQSAFNALSIVKELLIENHFLPIDKLSSKLGKDVILRNKSFFTARGSEQSGLATPTIWQILDKAEFIPLMVRKPPVTINGVEQTDDIFSA